MYIFFCSVNFKSSWMSSIHKNSESIYMLLQKKWLSIEMSKQEVCIIHKCIKYITNYGNSQNFWWICIFLMGIDKEFYIPQYWFYGFYGMAKNHELSSVIPIRCMSWSTRSCILRLHEVKMCLMMIDEKFDYMKVDFRIIMLCCKSGVLVPTFYNSNYNIKFNTFQNIVVMIIW